MLSGLKQNSSRITRQRDVNGKDTVINQCKVGKRGLQKNEKLCYRQNGLSAVTSDDTSRRPRSVGKGDLEDGRSGKRDGIADGSVGRGNEDV